MIYQHFMERADAHYNIYFHGFTYKYSYDIYFRLPTSLISLIMTLATNTLNAVQCPIISHFPPSCFTPIRSKFQVDAHAALPRYYGDAAIILISRSMMLSWEYCCTSFHCGNIDMIYYAITCDTIISKYTTLLFQYRLPWALGFASFHGHNSYRSSMRTQFAAVVLAYDFRAIHDLHEW